MEKDENKRLNQIKHYFGENPQMNMYLNLLRQKYGPNFTGFPPSSAYSGGGIVPQYFSWKGDNSGIVNFAFDPSVTASTSTAFHGQLQTNGEDLGEEFIATVAIEEFPRYGHNRLMTGRTGCLTIGITDTHIPTFVNIDNITQSTVNTALTTNLTNHATIVNECQNEGTSYTEIAYKAGTPASITLTPVSNSHWMYALTGTPLMVQFRYSKINSKLTIRRVFLVVNPINGELSYSYEVNANDQTIIWFGAKYIAIVAPNATAASQQQEYYTSAVPIRLRIFKGELPTPTLSLFPNAIFATARFGGFFGAWPVTNGSQLNILQTSTCKAWALTVANRPQFGWNWEIFLGWAVKTGTEQPTHGIMFVDVNTDKSDIDCGGISATAASRISSIGGTKGWCIQWDGSSLTSDAPITVGWPGTGTVNIFENGTIVRGSPNEKHGWVYKNVASGANATVSFDYVDSGGARTTLISFTDSISNMLSYNFIHFSGGTSGESVGGYCICKDITTDILG